MRARQVFQTGSVGNQTSAAIELDGDPDDIAYGFTVEAVGATPTVTYKWQGSLNGTDFFDLGYITDSSSVETFTARTVTAVGETVQWRSNVLRRYRFIRCVVTANTNVTYRATLVEYD